MSQLILELISKESKHTEGVKKVDENAFVPVFEQFLPRAETVEPANNPTPELNDDFNVDISPNMADVDRLAQHDSTRKNELLRIKRRPIYPEYEGYTLPPNMMRRKRLQQLHRSLIKMEKQQRRNDIRKERINARLRDKHIRKLNGVNAFIEDEGIDNERDLVEQYEKMRRPHPYAQRRARSRKRRDTITFAEGGTKVSIGEKHEKSSSSGSPANKSSSPRADSGNSKSTVTGSKDKKTASKSEDVKPAALAKRKTNSPPPFICL